MKSIVKKKAAKLVPQHPLHGKARKAHKKRVKIRRQAASTRLPPSALPDGIPPNWRSVTFSHVGVNFDGRLISSVAAHKATPKIDWKTAGF